MLDLVETVGMATQLNIPLSVLPSDKIAIACRMLYHANAILEQCGCEVTTIIKNPTWTQPVIYTTGMNGTGKFNE
jgi:hypothetical protein